jgi:hypothetical protein
LKLLEDCSFSFKRLIPRVNGFTEEQHKREVQKVYCFLCAVKLNPSKALGFDSEAFTSGFIKTIYEEIICS